MPRKPGIPLGHGLEVDQLGSIPACAGGTACQGELFLVQWCLSPRVRGNRLAHARFGVGVGSIPACAGEPATCWALLGRCRVYPRVCGGTDVAKLPWGTEEGLSPRVRGEPRAPYLCHGWNVGLSPRVRGNPGGPEQAVEGRRSIPACAGEPLH